MRLLSGMDPISSHSKNILCTLIDKKDQSKYVCFRQKRTEGICIGLSDGEDVWKADLSDTIISQMMKFSLRSPEDFALKLKGACSSGRAFVSLDSESAVLHLGSDPADLNVTFTKLTGTEARHELKHLLFQMADSLIVVENAGAASSTSPMKHPQKRHIEFEPRKRFTSTVAVKKRLPGDSLINPGRKRKRAATGVAFDEDDDA